MPKYLYDHNDRFEIGPFKAKSREIAEQAVLESIACELGPESYVKRLIEEFKAHPEYLTRLSTKELHNIKENYKIIKR
jgi:hypothetical protein